MAVASAGPYESLHLASRQITTPAPHHSVFYRPDALPAAQPTASKHCSQWSDKTNKSVWTLICCSEQMTAWCPPDMSGSLTPASWPPRALPSSCMARSMTATVVTAARCCSWISFAARTVHHTTLALTQTSTSVVQSVLSPTAKKLA